MGNSEVGHLNIGAGRIVHMDITRIELLIANKQFVTIPLFKQAMERGHSASSISSGCCSDGGVHSHITHLFALLELASSKRSRKFSSTASWTAATLRRTAAATSFANCSRKCASSASAKSPRVVGRYYAMDRDNRWERIELAYSALVHGEAEIRTDDPVAALQRSYEQDVTDEFIKPIVVTKGEGSDASPSASFATTMPSSSSISAPTAPARSPTRSPHRTSTNSPTPNVPKNLFYVGMTQYDKNLAMAQLRHRPRKTRAHPCASFRRHSIQESALRRDREIRARHLLLQRRRRKTFHRRRARSGAFAESRDLRPQARNVRRRHHRHGGQSHRARRIRRHHHELRERRHGGPLRQARSRPSEPSKPSMPASAASTRRLSLAAAPGSSPPITATPKP